MSTELKPCPFCNGSEASCVTDWNWGVSYLFVCNEYVCQAKGPKGRTPEDAAAAWNHRPGVPEPEPVEWDVQF